MFVDASALTSILTNEADAVELLARAQRYEKRMTSPLAIWETSVAVARVLDLDVPVATQAVRDFLELAGISTVPIDDDIGVTALDAFDRFGKGRHPARLNFGDCFAYACARRLDVPLLFKGVDFGLTDITAA